MSLKTIALAVASLSTSVAAHAGYDIKGRLQTFDVLLDAPPACAWAKTPAV